MEKDDLSFIDQTKNTSTDLLLRAAEAERNGDINALAEIVTLQDDLLRSLGNYAIRLEHKILIDDLTGIASSVDFESNIIPELDSFYNKARFAGDRSFPSDYLLCFIDMDGLGQINRDKGHQGGDDALINCAKALKSVTRNIDWVGRSGSRADEFLLLLRLTDTQAALSTEIIVESIMHRIERSLCEIDCSISLSIGVSRASECNDTEDLMHTSDMRMFENKVQHYAQRGINYLEYRSR